MERIEGNVVSNLWQMGTSKSEREVLQEGSETSYVVWFGGGGTDEKTGGGTGGGRVEDAKIFVESEKDGQD